MTTTYESVPDYVARAEAAERKAARDRARQARKDARKIAGYEAQLAKLTTTNGA